MGRWVKLKAKLIQIQRLNMWRMQNVALTKILCSHGRVHVKVHGIQQLVDGLPGSTGSLQQADLKSRPLH